MAKLKYKSIIPNNKPIWLLSLQLNVSNKFDHDYEGDMFDFDDLKKYIDACLIELQKQGLIHRSLVTTEIRSDEDKTVLFIRRNDKMLQTYYFE